MNEFNFTPNASNTVRNAKIKLARITEQVDIRLQCRKTLANGILPTFSAVRSGTNAATGYIVGIQFPKRGQKYTKFSEKWENQMKQAYEGPGKKQEGA